MSADGSSQRSPTTRVRVLGLALVVCAAAAAVIAVSGARGAFIDLKPPRRPVPALSQRPDLAGFEDVAFVTGDGIGLRGWWKPPENGGVVVLTHGWGDSREQMIPQALMLARHGFGALVYDLRAHGESGGTLCTQGDREREDVRAAISFAATRPGVRAGALGAVGFSIGALATADVAEHDARIAAVVLEAMPASLDEMISHDYGAHGLLTELPARFVYRVLGGVRPADMTPGARICSLAPRPLLLVYGERDHEVPASVGARLLASSCGNARLWTVRSGAHGGWGEHAAADLEDKLVDFFAAALLPRAVTARDAK
jgi:pimeloyl-ACP methyl ester carboxylesterase